MREIKTPILKLDPRVVADGASGLTVIPESTPLTRLNYFDGKFLRADDLRVEQLYLRRLTALSNQAGPLGVAYGYDVSLTAGGDSLQVSAGLALAPDGSVLFLPADASTGVQDLIDKSAQVLRAQASKIGPGIFDDCAVVTATPPDNTPSNGNLFLITISSAEAFCGSEDVFGKLCEEACVTSTDRPYIVEGIVIRAVPLRLRTPLITTPVVQIALKHLRSRVASAYFADERLAGKSLITEKGASGVLSDVWCFGADGPTGREVPIGVIARTGNKTVFLDAWIARREAIDTTARRYWAWRMAMRPWDVFLAQVLQFQCQLREIFSGVPDPSAGNPCADSDAIIRDASVTVGQLADFYEAVTTRFTLQPLLSAGTASGAKPPDVAGGLANISGLFKRLATARDAVLIPSDRILIDGGSLELPPGGYLPVNPKSALTVNQQVRRLLGKGVDLRFCKVRPDFVAHALETVQHMDRISLVEGLENPQNMPRVDILVPDGEIVGQATPSGTAFQASYQLGPKHTLGAGLTTNEGSVFSGAARIDVPQAGPVQFFLSVDTENPAPLLLLRPLIARLSTALFSSSVLASNLSVQPAAAQPAAPEAIRAVWIGFTCAQNPFAPEATGETSFELRFLLRDNATPPKFGNARLNGVFRFSRPVNTGSETRVTGVIGGTFSISGTGQTTTAGEIVSRELTLSLTAASSTQPATLKITFPLQKFSSVISVQWSGNPLVVHITETQSTSETSFQVAEAILQENADVLAPANVFHTIALHALGIVASGINTSDPNFADIAARQLFPPPPPATDDLIVKATLDWVLFHRRREKQCGVVEERPAPLPARHYRVYHHLVPLKSEKDIVSLIRQALLSNNTDFLVKSKIQFKEVDVVEFAAGLSTLDTPVTSIVADWTKVNPAARLVYSAIASQGAAIEDGEQLALDRLVALQKAIVTSPGTSVDTVAGPDVLQRIVAPPLDGTNADGVIVLLTQQALPSFVLTASGKSVVMQRVQTAGAGPYFMIGEMSGPGGAEETIQVNFTFTSDLPLTQTVSAPTPPPILTVDGVAQPFTATITSKTTFVFTNVPIKLPGDPPAQRRLEVTRIVVDASAATPGQQVFLTGEVASASQVTLKEPKQLIGTVVQETPPEPPAPTTHLARLLIWREGQPPNRNVMPTQDPFLVTFDANDKLVGTLPAALVTALGNLKVRGIEYDSGAAAGSITKRTTAVMKALDAANRLAANPGKKSSKVLAAEKNLLKVGAKVAEDLIFLAISQGLIG